MHRRQITDADIGAVADLLAEGFRRSTRQNWLNIFAKLSTHNTPSGFPKYGYLMESKGVPVAAILVVSSLMHMNGVARVRCNLSSWYVSPAFRSYGPLFISGALKSTDVTYINVSPAPHTLAILQVQGFSRYSDGQFLAFATPFTPSGGARVELVTGELALPFGAAEQELLRAHARYGCMSLWCAVGDEAFPFVFRPRTLRGLLPCCQLIYCRNIQEFVRFAKPIGRFFARRGRPLIMIDANGPIPGLSGKYVDGFLPKYFKGAERPSLGDLAFTETALFGI